LERLRRLEAVRIKKSAGGLARALREMILSMSFVDDIHTFYRDLLELSVGTAHYVPFALQRLRRAAAER
jgi:nucleolar GTP-binding protein